MRTKVIICLSIIFLIGTFFRFWKLADYPVSLSIDEVEIAYDSYSILKTGHDQHGVFLPLSFKSIGDYKAPILVYAMVPAIKIFGLNEFGTRFTIAIFGSITVLLVYLLIKELLYNPKIGIYKRESIAILTALSIAISPWHIKFSRGTFEAILALFLLIAAVYLFLRLSRQKSNFLWLSAIIFSLSAYTYHAERVIVPSIVIGLILIYKKSLLSQKRNLFIFLIAGLMFSLPLIGLMMRVEGQDRATKTFIDRDIEVRKELESQNSKNTIDRVLNNKLLILANFWFKRYLDYSDLNYLFVRGSNLVLDTNPSIGLMYLYELGPFLIGIWLIFIKRKNGLLSENYIFIIFWLLIGPLAASFANNAQHPLRSLTSIPMPQLFIGWGSWWIIDKLKPMSLGLKLSSCALIFTIIILSWLYYGDIYFKHSPINQSEYYSYGLKQLAINGWIYKDNYQQVIIDPKFGSDGPNIVGIPYAYFLFYNRYDPQTFQNNRSVNFDKFVFRDIYWPEDQKLRNTLFIGSPWSLPPSDIPKDQIIEKIFFLNDKLGFLIVKSNDK